MQLCKEPLEEEPLYEDEHEEVQPPEQRGPVVYAFEGVVNDDDVQSLMIDVSRLNEAQIETEAEGILKGAVLLDIPAVRLEGSDALYSEKPPRQKSVIARAIPYYMWGNRGLNQMRVWMHTLF